jgi:hypothetical protein
VTSACARLTHNSGPEHHLLGAGEHELFLTYACAFVFPDIEMRSPEATQIGRTYIHGCCQSGDRVAEMSELAAKDEI